MTYYHIVLFGMMDSLVINHNTFVEIYNKARIC